MRKRSLALLLASLFVLPFVSCVKGLWGDDEIEPEAGYYQIPTKSLTGWDEGVCYFDGKGTRCDYYIVSNTDTIDGTITLCLNTGNNHEADRAMVVHLAPNADVLKVILSDFRFNGHTKDDEVEFTIYNKSNTIVGHITVPYISPDTSSLARSPFTDNKGMLSISKAMDYERFTEEAFSTIGDSLRAVSYLRGAELANFMTDYIGGRIEGELLTTSKDKILTAKTIKSYLQMHYEKDRERLMGNASIEITSVRQTDATTVTVEGRISKRYSIPRSHTAIHDGAIENMPNRVMYGITIGTTPYPSLYLSKHCTDLEVVSGEKFSFTFNLDTELGKECYLFPFLIPEHCLMPEDEPLPDYYTCIRYGNASRFTDLNVEFSKFKQLSCVRNRSGSGYEATFSINAKIPHQYDNMKNWGIIIKSMTGKYAMSYRAKKAEWYTTIPQERNFTCTLQLTEADAMDQDVERISPFTITPFVEFKNCSPSIIHLENEDYTILVRAVSCSETAHPHAVDIGLSVKWACCNVEADGPWSYGGLYAWGETGSRKNHSLSTYKYIRDLDRDGDYWDDDANWINIGTDISGTSYDAAHVKWGGNWRMPTFSEAVELYNECIWEYTSGGYRVTGPNGRSIFLPTVGHKEHERYGKYWIGTLIQEEKSNCNAYNFYFNSKSFYSFTWDYRHCGFAIRPVTE